MAKSLGSCIFLAALLFLTMESSLFGTANAISMGQALQAAVPKLQAVDSFAPSTGMKINLPTEAHEFIERVRSKMNEDPSLLQKPASWDTLLSFVELASGVGARGKTAHNTKKQQVDDEAAPVAKKHAKKSSFQKVVHHLLEADNEDEDDGKQSGLSEVTDAVTESKPSGSNLLGTVIFFVTLLLVVGGVRYLALFLTQKNKDVNPIDFIIGTNFTTGAMISGLVAGFSFSFIDSIVLFWTMVLMDGMLSKLPGAEEEASFAAYANIISNFISGAISTSAGQAVSQGLNVDQGEVTPFWTQLVGALFGGFIGLMLAKVIPHQKRLRAAPASDSAEEGAQTDSADSEQ